MGKQSYILPRQAILVLIITRLLFSTAHFYSLHAGRYIQDILPAVPAAFALNFLTAVPLLMLMKRYPSKDPVECAVNLFGKAGGMATGVFYLFFFGISCVSAQVTFRYYFTDSMIPEASAFAILIPLAAIAAYGAFKGMESIARFGTIIFVIWAVSFGILTLSLIPSIRPSVSFHFLLPLFYNGPGIFFKELIVQMNDNIQIVSLAFCASFFRSGTKTGKAFVIWNTSTFAFVLGLFTLCVAMLGPYLSSQFFPMQSISAQSTIGVFDRLDSVYSMSWTFNVVLTVTFYTCLQLQCLQKMGLNGHRLLQAVLTAAADVACALFLQKNYSLLQTLYMHQEMLAFNAVAMLGLPAAMLIVGAVRGGNKTHHEMA